MTGYAAGAIETTSWDEQTIEEQAGLKMARVSATSVFTGDIQGESHVEYLLVYTSDDESRFVGLERVDGRIGDREGTFVLQQQGIYADGSIRISWFVVPGSGSGGLTGLRGEGGYFWEGEHGVPAPFTLDYELDD